jgi:hypothetical protein
MSDFTYEDLVLDQEHQDAIVNEWNNRKTNPPSLKELVCLAFPDIEEKLQDGRSKYGKCVKSFLASKNIKARAAHEYKGRDDVSLSQEMKEYIDNNGHAMTDVDIAKIIFDDPTLTNLHKEARLVAEYRKENNIEQTLVPAPLSNNVPVEDYKPPKTMNLAITKVNKYLLDAINKEKITAKQKLQVQSLISYLHTYRFLHQINSYESLN